MPAQKIDYFFSNDCLTKASNMLFFSPPSKLDSIFFCNVNVLPTSIKNHCLSGPVIEGFSSSLLCYLQLVGWRVFNEVIAD